MFIVSHSPVGTARPELPGKDLRSGLEMEPLPSQGGNASSSPVSSPVLGERPPQQGAGPLRGWVWVIRRPTSGLLLVVGVMVHGPGLVQGPLHPPYGWGKDLVDHESKPDSIGVLRSTTTIPGTMNWGFSGFVCFSSPEALRLLFFFGLLLQPTLPQLGH